MTTLHEVSFFSSSRNEPEGQDPWTLCRHQVISSMAPLMIAVVATASIDQAIRSTRGFRGVMNRPISTLARKEAAPMQSSASPARMGVSARIASMGQSSLGEETQSPSRAQS